MDWPEQQLGFWPAVASGLYKSLLFGDQTFNYVLWTIKIEFYGSLLIYAAFALTGRNRGLHMMLCGGLFLYLQTRSIYSNMYAYFFLGSLLAQIDFEALKARLFSPATSAALLIAGGYLAGHHQDSAAYLWLQPLSHAIEHVAPEANTQVIYTGFGAALVIIAVLLARRNGMLSSSLNTRPLLALGKLSFSVYLLHPIVLSSLGKFIYIEMGRTAGSVIVCLIAVIATTCLLSHFFFRYVDGPSVKLADAFGRALFATTARHSGHRRTESLAYQSP